MAYAGFFNEGGSVTSHRDDAKILQLAYNRLVQKNFTVQMAEWYRASAFGSVDLGFDSESGQTNDFSNC